MLQPYFSEQNVIPKRSYLDKNKIYPLKILSKIDIKKSLIKDNEKISKSI